jgi:ZIP family zinc transporter
LLPTVRAGHVANSVGGKSSQQRQRQQRQRSARKLAEQLAEGQASMWVCVGMSFLAGLSTSLGAAVVLLSPSSNVSREQMAFALALAAGVMLSVTVLEFWLPILEGGLHFWPVLFYSSVGVVSFLLLSYCIPEPQLVEGRSAHSHHAAWDDQEQSTYNNTIGKASAGDEELGSIHNAEDGKTDEPAEQQRRRYRLVAVLMVALTAHNFPEGFAVAISAMKSDRLGVVVMFAIAAHNVPEGISIALPVLAATGSRWNALGMATLSGMAEPLGALTALIVVHLMGGDMSEGSIENLLCVVGGVMCAVAVKELLPEALQQSRPKAAGFGFTAGCLVMWASNRLGA